MTRLRNPKMYYRIHMYSSYLLKLLIYLFKMFFFGCIHFGMCGHFPSKVWGNLQESSQFSTAAGFQSCWSRSCILGGNLSSGLQSRIFLWLGLRSLWGWWSGFGREADAKSRWRRMCAGGAAHWAWKGLHRPRRHTWRDLAWWWVPGCWRLWARRHGGQGEHGQSVGKSPWICREGFYQSELPMHIDGGSGPFHKCRWQGFLEPALAAEHLLKVKSRRHGHWIHTQPSPLPPGLPWLELAPVPWQINMDSPFPFFLVFVATFL